MRRSCQKEDWPHHRKHCGKKKVLKNIKGTAQDPYWQHPNLPDHMLTHIGAGDASGNVAVSSLGFGTPHPSRPHSPALQRQVSLITGDKLADYFLFDETDHPIRFAIQGDMWMKISFRNLRSGAIFSAGQEGLEAMAEYLIKVMGGTPGLSRERILDQFNREYGDDFPAQFAHWANMGAKNGYGSEDTFLEIMSRNLAATTPRVMEMYKQGWEVLVCRCLARCLDHVFVCYVGSYRIHILPMYRSYTSRNSRINLKSLGITPILELGGDLINEAMFQVTANLTVFYIDQKIEREIGFESSGGSSHQNTSPVFSHTGTTPLPSVNMIFSINR